MTLDECLWGLSCYLYFRILASCSVEQLVKSTLFKFELTLFRLTSGKLSPVDNMSYQFHSQTTQGQLPLKTQALPVSTMWVAQEMLLLEGQNKGLNGKCIRGSWSQALCSWWELPQRSPEQELAQLQLLYKGELGSHNALRIKETGEDSSFLKRWCGTIWCSSVPLPKRIQLCLRLLIVCFASLLCRKAQRTCRGKLSPCVPREEQGKLFSRQ